MKPIAQLALVKGQFGTTKLKPNAKSRFWRSWKVPVAFLDQLKKVLFELEAQGTMEHVEPGGVINDSL